MDEEELHRAKMEVEAHMDDKKFAQCKNLLRNHPDVREACSFLKESLDLAVGDGKYGIFLEGQGGAFNLYPEFHRHFLIDVLPDCIATLMNRRDIDQQNYHRCMYQLLIRCLDVVKSQLRFVYEINQPDRDDLDDHIHAVLANDPVYIEALVHVGSMICNHTMPFYELLNDSVHSDLTSNFAFEGNGLQLCYLSCTRTDTTLRALYYTTVMFYNVAEYFELNELVRIVRRFVAVVFTRMLGAAPQWLKSDAQLSTELRQTVILLAKSLFPNGTEHETFELDMAFKLLQSPYLEHRLAAIVILRSYATFFIRSTTDGRRRASDNMVEVVMTADALQEWFNANDVIAHVFGANAHTEIISRCRPILRFRALGNNITPANLQALVGGVQAHHESVRLQIFTAVTEMVFAVRSPVVFEYLFQLLENIPLSEWDVLLLEFVCKCAAPALRFVSSMNMQPQPLFGLKSLWQILTSDGSLPKSLVVSAMENFLELLKCPQFMALRCTYLLRCVHTLKAHASSTSENYINSTSDTLALAKHTSMNHGHMLVTTTVCEALKRIIDECEWDESDVLTDGAGGASGLDVSQDTGPETTPSGLVGGGDAAEGLSAEAVEKERSAFRLLMRCSSQSEVLGVLQDAYNVVSEVVSGVERCLTEIDASPEVRHAFYTNAEQLSHRLDLLAVVLKGGLALTRDHLDTLWRCCQTRVIDTATSVPFGEQVLFWLDALIGDTSFPKESILYLFSNRASLSPSNMSKGEFKLFTTLFVKVNFDGHKPKDDLIGLDRLWALALTCESDELAVEVNEFVIALYANFDVSHADDAEQRLSRRLEFIGRCMRCVAMATSAHNESDADIQAAVNNVLSATEDHIIPESTTEGESETSGSVTYTDISITRALTMLSQYNKQYAQDNRDKLANLTISRTGYVFEGQPLPLKICPMGQPVINLNAMTVTTIGEVRRLIATTLNVHHTALRIIASGKELKGDTQTLAQAQIKPGARLNVMVSPLVQEGGMTNENASINSPQSPADNAPPTASSAAASDVPTVILASGHYFDLLFSLLKNESAPYVGGLWALIESLPYNVDTYFAFVDLGEGSATVTPRWRTLLNPHAPFQLLYVLRIAALLLTSGDRNDMSIHDADTMDTGDDDTWGLQFEQRGGVVLLYTMMHTVCGWTARAQQTHTPDTTPTHEHMDVTSRPTDAQTQTEVRNLQLRESIAVQLFERLLKMLYYFTTSCMLVSSDRREVDYRNGRDSGSGTGGVAGAHDGLGALQSGRGKPHTHAHTYYQSFRTLSLLTREIDREDVDRHVLGASDAIPTNERHVCVEGKEVPNISSFVTDIVDILQFIVRVSSQSVGETGKLSENKAGSGLMSLTGMGRSLSSSASNHDNGSQGNGTGTGNGHGHGNSNINQSLVTQLSRLGDSAHTQQVAMRMEETLKECVSLSMCLLIGVYQSASWTAMENSADAFTHVLARLSKSVVPTNATKPATNATKPATKPPTPGAGTSIANELDTHPYMAGNGTGVGSGGSSVLGHLLVTTASIDLRNEAAVGLRMLSKALTLEDKEHLLGAFASLLRVVPKESTQCQDLFDLVSAVVQSLPSTQPTSHDSAIVVLMNVLMDRLLTHPPMETHRTGEPDVFLGCLLRLLGNVASKGGIPTDTPSHTGTVAQVPKGNAPTRYILDELVQFVTKKCLFDMPTLTNHGPRSPPLCKTAESRTIARELLDTLGRSTMFGTRVRHLLCGLLMDTHCGGKESGGSELTVLSRMHTDESVVAATSASGRASTRADTTASATATRTPSHTSTSKDASLVVACGCEGVCVNDVCDVACGEGLCGADPELSGGVTRIQERSASGYVGLENLGATCYMNSLMQNLFMVPQFRRGVLATRTKPWTTTPPTPHALVLHQLQMIFAHLQESLLKCYSAQGFCSVYESEGACVDVNLQMDVDEFFNVLFDRLEALLKGSPQQSLLKDTFGGKLLQQVISKDCEHVSEREQDLFSIQCDVVNKQNIRESLAMYVKGEMLEGDNKYYCEKCDLKVAAEKRVSVQSLPNHLIFHLKRFEFDMELMRRVKVNDRYEFPPVLDMFPFTLEGLMAAERAEKGEPPLPREHPDDHYIYDLGGILVHKGSADSGHYYSIISDWEVEKTNSGEATSHHNSAGDNSFGGRWMLFDDSNVRDFNAKDIPDQTYGGPYNQMGGSSQAYSRNNSGRSTYNESKSGLKHFSAYMLFYVSRGPKPTTTATTVAEWYPKYKYVPCHMLKNIWRQNYKYTADRMLLDTAHFNWVWQLTGGNSTEPMNDMTFVQTRTLFFLKVVLRANNSRGVHEQWRMSVLNAFQTNAKACAWFAEWLMDRDEDLRGWVMEDDIVNTDDVTKLIVRTIQLLLNPATEDQDAGDNEMQIDSTTNIHNERLVPGLVQFLSSMCPLAFLHRTTCAAYIRLLYLITFETASNVARVALLRDERVAKNITTGSDAVVLDRAAVDHSQAGLIGDLINLFLGRDMSEAPQWIESVPKIITRLCAYYSPDCPDDPSSTLPGVPLPSPLLFPEGNDYMAACLASGEGIVALHELLSVVCPHNNIIALQALELCEDFIVHTEPITSSPRRKNSAKHDTAECPLHQLMRAILSIIADNDEGASMSPKVHLEGKFRTALHLHLERVCAMIPELLSNSQTSVVGRATVRHVVLLAEEHAAHVLPWLIDHYQTWLLQWALACQNDQLAVQMIVTLAVSIVECHSFTAHVAERADLYPYLPLAESSVLDSEYMSQPPTNDGSRSDEERFYLHNARATIARRVTEGKKRSGDRPTRKYEASSDEGSMGHSSGPSSPDTPRHTTVAKRRLSQDTDKWGMKTGCSQSVAVTMNDTQRSVRETLFCYVLVNVTDLTVYMPRSVVEGIPSERVQQTLGRSLLAYFRLLAVLYPPAPSANVVRCVRENIDQFGELFWLVDAQLAETDYSKLEGLAWWLTVMCEETTGDALVAKFLGQTVASRGHPSTQLMCDFFISLNGTATQISFNERLLSVFYRLVRLLCCYSIDFIRVWMGNNNFTWAVENLMTANVVYSKAMTEVLLVVEYTATRNTQRHTQQREEAIANCARLPPALKTAVWVAPIDREQQGLTERRANLIQKLVNNHTLGDLAPVGGFVVYTCLNTKQPDPKPLYALFLQVYIGNKGRGLDVLWARLISLLTASTAMQDKLAANASQPQAHALPPPGYAEGAESRRTSRKGHDNAHGRSVRSGVRRGDVGVQTGGSSASIDIDEDDLDDFLPPGQSKSSPAHNASHSPTQARVDHVVTPEDMEREATLQCILRVFARVCEWVQQDLVPRNPPRNQDEFTIISITRSKLQSADAENVHVTMEMALLQRYLMFEPVCVLACGCGRDDGGCSTSATTQTATADTATLPHPTTEPATSAPHTNTPATTTTTTGTGTSTDAPPRPCRQDISRAAGLQLLVTVCDLVPPTLHDVRTHLLRDHLRIGPRSSLPTNRNARAYKMSPAGGRHTIGSYLGHTLTECTGPGYARMSVCGDLDPPRTTHTPTQLRQLKEYCGMVNQIVLLTLRPPIEFDSEDDDTDGEESVVLEGLQLNMAVAMTTTSVLEYSPHRIWPTSWSSSATPVARSQLCEHVRMESNRQAWEKYILFVLKGGDGYLVNMPVDVLDRFAALVDVVLHTASVPTKTAIATYIESVVSDMLADERSPKATLLQIYKVLCVCINTNALDKQLDVASSVSVLGAANPSTSTTNPELLLVKNIAEKLAARS